jgi:hypothetical protein
MPVATVVLGIVLTVRCTVAVVRARTTVRAQDKDSSSSPSEVIRSRLAE